jgi:hypothetical protein
MAQNPASIPMKSSQFLHQSAQARRLCRQFTIRGKKRMPDGEINCSRKL